MIGEDLAALPYLYLTSTGWKTGRPHEIEIWFTSLDGRCYLISEQGEAAHWVQNVRRNPAITFRLGDQVFTGRGRVVDAAQEPALHRRICDLSRSKYGWGEGLVVELRPESRALA